MPIKDALIRIINWALPEPGQPVKEAALREAAGTTIDADEEQWRKLSADVNRDLAPMTQTRMQRMAHFLWEQNLLGNRLIELPVAYLLAEGVELSVEDEDNQKILDQFWRDPINNMDIKLEKKVREMALFGEQCYPTFVNEHDGMVRLGYLDPAMIATIVMDPDNPEQPIGVVTTKNKQGKARRYRVIINGPEDIFTQRTQGIRAGFTDGEAFYFAINDLSSGSRGRSDLLAQADWLDAYDQFMFGELDRYGFLRSFIWDVTLKGSTPDEVKARARDISTPKPGSVRVHNDAEEWSAETPSLAAVDTAAGARLFRNHVLGGATMPETWFGGGGDVNRATAAEMHEPTFKIYSMRQRRWKYILESIGRYVLLKNKSAQGEATIDWADPAWDVKAEFPELVSKDTSKYAAALQQVVAACVQAIAGRVMTSDYAVQLIGAVAARLGIETDPDEELKNAQAEGAAAAEADVFTGVGAGATDPAATAAMQEARERVESARLGVEEARSEVSARFAEIERLVRDKPDAWQPQFAEAIREVTAAMGQSHERLIEALSGQVTRHEMELTLKHGKTQKTVTLPDGRSMTLDEEDIEQ